MQSTAKLLTDFECCPLKGFWSRDWQRRRMSHTEFLYDAIRVGLTEVEREDFGVCAGEHVMNLAVTPGLETPSSHHIHDSICHLAALADTLTCAIRRPEAPAWQIPSPATLGEHLWHPSAYLDPSGSKLRRVVLVTSWSDDRHFSECRSWYGLGEVCAYRLPMTMAVCVLGAHRDGKRHGPFSRGFQHPVNHQLRFRKKSRSSSEIFSDRWGAIWREDHNEISNHQWLQSMISDDILRDVCFTVEIPVPEVAVVKRIREMAGRKMAAVHSIPEQPPPSLSVCDRPPCQFKPCCWSSQSYSPDEDGAFVSIHPK